MVWVSSNKFIEVSWVFEHQRSHVSFPCSTGPIQTQAGVHLPLAEPLKFLLSIMNYAGVSGYAYLERRKQWTLRQPRLLLLAVAAVGAGPKRCMCTMSSERLNPVSTYRF